MPVVMRVRRDTEEITRLIDEADKIQRLIDHVCTSTSGVCEWRLMRSSRTSGRA